MRKTIRHAMGQNRQQGLALIEALVSLLILALGVLGLAGVQTRSLIETRNTSQRFIAVQLSADLAERIQMNSAGARAGAYSTLDFGKPPVETKACQPASSGGAGVNCSPSEMAASDMKRWHDELSKNIPGGDARTFPNTQAGTPQVGILISWPPIVSKKTLGTEGADAFLPVSLSANGEACPADRMCHFTWVPLR